MKFHSFDKVILLLTALGTSTADARSRSNNNSYVIPSLSFSQQKRAYSPFLLKQHAPSTSAPSFNILNGLRGGSSESESSDDEIEVDANVVVDDTVDDTVDEVEATTEEIIPEPASIPPEPTTTTTATDTISPPVAATETTTTPSSIQSILNNPKMKNAIERTGPAVVMLSLLYVFIHYTGETGLSYFLIPMMQFGMYKETTGIIEDHNNSNGSINSNIDLEFNIQKWWWFVTIFLSTTGRSLISNIIPSSSSSFLRNPNAVNLICFGMASIGLVMAVVGMASHVDASADKFRSYLGEVASSHFALLFLVGQSSFWIKTIQSFGIGWVLYPALLVIVNDTMAYVFGVLFGNHKLLPKLSPKKTVEGFVGAAFSTTAVAYPLLKFFVSFMSKRSGSGTAGDMSNCFEKFSSVLSSSVSVLEPVLEPLLDDSGTIIDTAAATTINSVTKTNTDNLFKHAIVMALYTSIISPFGGFLASAVKRAHGAKDFGSLIPGHGGVVDRFDCQVVTAPFVFLYLKSCFDC